MKANYLKNYLLPLVLFLVSMVGISQTTFTVDGLEYKVISTNLDEVELTGGTPATTDLVIPQTVSDGTDTFTVTSVGRDAFRQLGLTSVNFPTTIVTIGTNSFSQNQLTSLTIPSSVTSIGLRAFRLNQIESVVIPNSVATLGNGSFESNILSSVTISENLTFIGHFTFANNQLTTVTIPANVNSLGNECFRGNPSLTEVIVLNTIPPAFRDDPFFRLRENIDLIVPLGTQQAYLEKDWTGFASINESSRGDFTDGVLFYEITSTVPNEVQVIGGFPPSEFTIPSTVSNGAEEFTVTSIATSALTNRGLTSVVLPNTLKATGLAAFSGNDLTSVMIPEGITTISKQSFQNNEQLSTIDFPNSVTVIDNNAFRNNGLTQLILPANVSAIGIQTFENNPITEVTSFNTRPPNIQNNSFSNSNQIKLYVPKGTAQAYEAAGWSGFNTIIEFIAAPYLEDFETFTTSEDPFEAENGWSAVDSGRYNWEAAPATDTGTGGTGPNPSINTGNYFYTEATDSRTGDTTDLISPFIDLSNLSNPRLTFNYHMFGSGMGTLKVLVNGINLVFSLSGEQQTLNSEAYRVADINLSAYAGQIISVTFRGIRGNGFRSDIAIDNVVFDNYPLVISPKVFLQGATTNPNIIGKESLMRDDLDKNAQIPINSPYSDAVIRVFLDSPNIVDYNNLIVDWVFIELRDANDNSIVVKGKSALLQRDGDVVATDGVSPLSFSAEAADYFISVNHRNHLGVITANTVALSRATTAVDFTDPTIVFGGATALTEVNDIFTMIGGDPNEDGQVLSTDITEVVSEIGSSNYRNTDLDMNGQILSTDISIGNQNIGRGQQFSTEITE